MDDLDTEAERVRVCTQPALRLYSTRTKSRSNRGQQHSPLTVTLADSSIPPSRSFLPDGSGFEHGLLRPIDRLRQTGIARRPLLTRQVLVCVFPGFRLSHPWTVPGQWRLRPSPPFGRVILPECGHVLRRPVPYFDQKVSGARLQIRLAVSVALENHRDLEQEQPLAKR